MSRAEPVLVTWTRRALSLPLYFSLAAWMLATLPLWLPVLALLDGITDLAAGRRGLWARSRAVCFLSLYLVCEVIGVLGATWVWLTSAGGRLPDRQTFVERNAALQRWFTGTLFRAALRLYSMRLERTGFDGDLRGPFLLLVRHTSTADTVLAASLVANPQRLLLRYVLKRELLWDPCLDIVGQRLPNAFVDRSGSHRQAELQAVASLAHGLDARSAVLIYPEGTRFSRSKRDRAIAALQDEGKADLAQIAAGFQHVLPPRLGGPLSLLQAAPGVDVLILEHCGFEGAATLPSLWRGALVGQTLRARLRRIPATDIPAERRDLWLFQRWAEVDAWVADARAADRPPDRSPP